MGKYHKRTSRGRIMLASLLVILAGAMVAPLSGYIYVGIAGAQEQPAVSKNVPAGDTWDKTNPRSDYWRAVRAGQGGYSTDKAPGGNDLITSTGQDWRQIRNGPVASLGPWFLLVVVLALGLFYILKGQNKIEQPRSGRTMTRWRVGERVMHWTTATLFVIMSITGLSLLFGRAVLIPLLGPDGFAVWAGFSKLLHNYLGPLFTVAILLMIVSWIKDNMPNRSDLTWFKKGGGMLGKHASAGRMNAGEKVWFWFIATAGLAACISGLVFDFPNWVQSRFAMQTANIIHAVLAIGWIGFFFGHAYIGTLGTEGALEGMTTGEVSEEWAKQHHDRWYEDVKSGRQDVGAETDKSGKASPRAPGSV